MNEKSHHAVQITPLKIYLTVGAALFVLTGITVEVSRIHLGAWNAIVAMFIATVKGLLVALFFMHLLHDRKIYAVVVGMALVMLGLLIGLTMGDILSRGDINEYETGPIHPEAQIYSRSAGGPAAPGDAFGDTLRDTTGVVVSDTTGNEQDSVSEDTANH